MLHKLNHGEIPRLLGYGSKMTNVYGRVLFSHLHRDSFVSFNPAHGVTITRYIYTPEYDSVSLLTLYIQPITDVMRQII